MNSNTGVEYTWAVVSESESTNARFKHATDTSNGNPSAVLTYCVKGTVRHF